ncbi:hypothetical protein ABH927_002216 [Planotetraspora sp. GP83]
MQGLVQGFVRESVCSLGRDVVRGIALGRLACRAVGSRRRRRCGTSDQAWSRRYGSRLAGHCAAVGAREAGRVLLGAFCDDRFLCRRVRVIGGFPRCHPGRLAVKRVSAGRGAGGQIRQSRGLAWESGRLGRRCRCVTGDLGGLIGECGFLAREAGSLTGEPGRPHGNVARLSAPERLARCRRRRRRRRRFRLRTAARQLVRRRGGRLCGLSMRRLLNRAGDTPAGHTRTEHTRAGRTPAGRTRDPAHAVGGSADPIRTRCGVVGRSGVVGRVVGSAPPRLCLRRRAGPGPGVRGGVATGPGSGRPGSRLVGCGLTGPRRRGWGRAGLRGRSGPDGLSCRPGVVGGWWLVGRLTSLTPLASGLHIMLLGARRAWRVPRRRPPASS